MSGQEPTSTTSGEEPIATNPRGLCYDNFSRTGKTCAIIKSERMWYLNTHAVTSAGVLSFLQSVRGGFVLQSSLLLCMCFLSVIGLLTSLRLKAELEECLEKIHAMVARAQVDQFMALGRLEGRRSRYPAFRWIFPVVYCLSAMLFFALFVYRVTLARHP